jgi:hypothetical protein
MLLGHDISHFFSSSQSLSLSLSLSLMNDNFVFGGVVAVVDVVVDGAVRSCN